MNRKKPNNAAVSRGATGKVAMPAGATTRVKKGKATANSATGAAPERASRARQRQRLIDACISALHIHGPSRTTVEKVVALADMSPGIVRFYFDSKDAMLVASLAYLASEFEERVMVPVSQLKATPVKALQLLVELYLDPEVASPRKVSVWYSFWGEASSRQEYLDICGKKDDDFAALVHDLIGGVIAQTGQVHLDADGVALGLIGVLEVLWQGIAFNSEVEIDREAAKRRSLAFLRSVFPGQFAAPVAAVTSVGNGSLASVPGWAYSSGALLALERDRLFRPSWQLVGHEADIPDVGDYVTADLAGERVLVVRTSQEILAFRNSCRKRPHVLLSERSGHLTGAIECGAHGLVYGLDGKLQAGSTPGDLTPLELSLPGKFILVRALAGRSVDPASSSLLEIAGAPSGDWESLPDLKPVGSGDIAVAADWKLMVEQWLEALPRPKGVRRSFLSPNQLLEVSASEALVLQVVPESPGRCRLRRLDYSAVPAARRKAQRAGEVPAWLEQDIEVAESMQAGLAAGMDATSESTGPVSEELEEFRAGIALLLPLAQVA